MRYIVDLFESNRNIRRSHDSVQAIAHYMKIFSHSVPIYAALAVLTVLPVAAQSFTLRSAEDPMEAVSSLWWRNEQNVELIGGFSLIGPHWRTLAGVEATFARPGLSARLRGFVRGGIYGYYEEDFDEWYDLVRLVDFVRFSGPAGLPLYLRVGPLERLRLGSGHLVESFHSWTAWEERTIGIEAQWLYAMGDLSLFASDLRFNRLLGGHVTLHPFTWVDNERLASLRLGAGYVTDLATREGPAPMLTGFSVEASATAFRAGPVALAPFVSIAGYTNYGNGLAFGIDLKSPNFAELLRFRLRGALYYNSGGFIPGYVGAFYPVSNPGAYIVETDDFASPDLAARADVALSEAGGGADLLTEFYFLLFERLELWYYFRRHYGSQALSVFHTRLAFTLPNGMRFAIGQDRGGLRSFFSLFNELNEQTVLVFRTDYPFTNNLAVHLRARYTYEPYERGQDAPAREAFLVIRRFEPGIGFHLVF